MSGNSFNLNFTNGDNAAIAQAIALNIQIPSTTTSPTQARVSCQTPPHTLQMKSDNHSL